jgi:hypothetical protein
LKKVRLTFLKRIYFIYVIRITVRITIEISIISIIENCSDIPLVGVGGIGVGVDVGGIIHTNTVPPG